MQLKRPIQIYPVATAIAALILVGWVGAAFLLEQSIFAVQTSRSLLKVGALDGQSFRDHGWWRVLSSQFLHVYFVRMVFNTMGVFVIANSLEGVYGGWRLTLIYLLGGSIGQIASVAFYPYLVSSGASQALMSLCGAALVLNLPRWSRLLALVIVVAQIALDNHVAGAIKAGHGFGFAAGVLIGGVILLGYKRPEKALMSEMERDRG